MNIQRLIKPLIKTALSSALLAGAGAASASQVKTVDLDYSANQAKETVFQVKLINGNLTLMNPNVQMTLGMGSTICEKGHSFNSGELYLGPVSANNGSLNKSQAALSDWTVDVKGSTDGEIIEYGGPPLIFDINVAAIQNNYFNPVKVVEAEMQKAMNGGLSEVAFLTKTRLFKVERTVSLAGKCVHKNNSSAGYKVDQELVDFMVEYIGAPQLVANAQQVAPPVKLLAVPLGGNNTIQSSFGVIVHDGNLQTAANYTGMCPKDLMFQAQINAQGKGAMQLHLKRDGQALYTSPQFDYNGGAVNHPITVKAEHHGKPLNETQSFKMNLFVRTRGEPNEPWSDYEEVSRKSWSQTCTPLAGINAAAGNAKVAPVTPASQQAPAPTAGSRMTTNPTADPTPTQPRGVRQQLENPPPVPKSEIQAQPVKPTPQPQPRVRATESSSTETSSTESRRQTLD
ncbi:MAG: hypothetical protein WDZ30_04535 [Cellvibrionaceae bacterium]